ncbi:ROK family transcriptional regulator [Pseudothermotoga thermarum]|uniref:ROK family protein n=1 Tax=Pseudothermotoga thermarum DSM 5069 TaxID=688269 RepID=F7YUJ9_9THEM|nr:ROK family transcriptional regulator [Pseudothermotoga thermarum]AEH51471.1 ROK family protein [Pseudothermotoga thermarum DSM 5069]
MRSKIDPKSMKEINKRIIFRHLIESGPMSRVELVRKTRLANSAVWRIIQELEEEGLISRKDYLERTATKGATVFGPSKSFACSIILDIQVNQSIIALGFLDKTWKIVDSFETNGLEKFLAKTDKVISKLCNQDDVDKNRTVLSISIPGVVDEEGSILSRAPNLQWQNINLVETFSKYGLKVTADNDANLSLLAEWFFSQDVRSAKNAFFLYFGEGIGGSLLIDGKIVKGRNGAAGEIGHTILKVLDSKYIEVEEMLSISKLVRKYEERTERNLRGNLTQKFENAVQKWRVGDKIATELFEEFTDNIATTLLNIGYTINPEVIIFGGIVNNIWEIFGNLVIRKIEILDKYDFMKGINYRDTVFKGTSPSLVGCNVAAIESLFVSI